MCCSRYLRARKFDVQGAYGQFTDTEKWLKEQRVDELYENFDVEYYEQARRMVNPLAAISRNDLSNYLIVSAMDRPPR